MKTKKFKIKIQTMNDFKNDFKKAWRAAEGGLNLKSEYDLTLSFQDIASLSRVFSPERMRMIQIIKEKKPVSIRELARMLERAQPNVQKDIQDLVALGIVQLKKVKTKGQKQESLQPSCPWDEFDVAI